MIVVIYLSVVNILIEPDCMNAESGPEIEQIAEIKCSGKGVFSDITTLLGCAVQLLAVAIQLHIMPVPFCSFIIGHQVGIKCQLLIEGTQVIGIIIGMPGKIVQKRTVVVDAGLYGGEPLPAERGGAVAYLRWRARGASGSCSGVLIDPRLVLTAGHCVRSPRLGAVRIARARIGNPSGTTITVASPPSTSTQASIRASRSWKRPGAPRPRASGRRPHTGAPRHGRRAAFATGHPARGRGLRHHPRAGALGAGAGASLGHARAPLAVSLLLGPRRGDGPDAHVRRIARRWRLSG